MYNYIIIAMRIFLFLLSFAVLGSFCPQNCQFCLQDAVCQACGKGYILSSNATCLTQTVNNCRVQLNSSHCSICEPTYQVNNGQCMKDFSGCVLRNSQGTCSYCWFGTKLSGNVCSGLINCQIMQSNGKCLQCYLGYTLTGGVCVQNRKQCLSKQSGLCTKCLERYILNGFTCLPQTTLPPSCSLYDYTVGRCLICNLGYQIYHKFCQRKDNIPFISTSTASTVAQNALSMIVDTLDGPSSTQSAPQIMKSDYITQDYADIQVKVSAGQGRSNYQQTCWQTRPNGGCAVCIEGYNLVNNACVKASPSCLTFDSQGRLCHQCRPELTLSQGNCLDNNCAVPIFSRCFKCLANFSPSAEGICINQNCLSLSAGKCIKCASGYNLSDANLCIKLAVTNAVTSSQTTLTNNPTTPASTSIVGCDLVANGVCARCSPNYYPNSNGKCKRVIIGCLQYDAAELNCVQCISVYTATPDGGCIYQQPVSNPPPAPAPVPVPVPSAPSPPKSSNTVVSSAAPVNLIKTPTIDINCQLKNNGSCAICKPRYLLNPYNFTCQTIPKECLTYNETNGNCLTCAYSFNLFLIWCLPRYTKGDPNCYINDINNYCTSCKPQYYNSRGQCLQVDSQCKTFEAVGGACLSCYSGYIIMNGQCILLSQQPSCLQYDFQSNCVQCAQRYYLQALACIPANPLCNNFNNQTGACIDCVVGYGLSSITNSCQAIHSPTPNCQTADPVGNCLSCSNRYYFSPQNLCLSVPGLCATYVQKGGQCLSCYTGYNLLADNSCVQKSLMNGCLSADSNGSCLNCTSQFILTAKGNCQARDTNCLAYDTKGSCTKCISLYYILSGKCTKEVKKLEKDPNCLLTDLMNFCLQCNSGYYISAGNCFLADQLCKTFDPSNGNCLTCYDGYRLNLNKCYLNNPIFNCKRFDGSICAQCLAGYSVGVDGSCVQK